MQFLLGLFFFSSTLLTIGGSLNCSYCYTKEGTCPGTKVECRPHVDACMSLILKAVGNSQMEIKLEGCFAKDGCMKLKDLTGKPLPADKVDGELPDDIPPGALIKKVVCNKAPPAFASFFPAFLGLLLMKLLF